MLDLIIPFLIPVAIGILCIPIFMLVKFINKPFAEKHQALIAHGVPTAGSIDRITLGSLATGSFYLHYSYNDTAGNKYTGHKNIGLYAFQHKKGNPITVYYDPSNPQRSTINVKQRKTS